MGTHQDNGEILADRIRRMGPELGRLHHDLWAQAVWLHAKWRVHQDLFAGNEQQTRLMEFAAVRTFNHLYMALTTDVIMHICRVTDEARTGKFENASLRQLQQLIQKRDVGGRVMALISGANNNWKAVRDARNKVLAHRDLNAAVYPDALPRDHVRTDHIHAALAQIAAVLNEVEVAYGGATVRYDINAHFSDAGGLIRYMEMGKKALREERQRFGLESEDDG